MAFACGICHTLVAAARTAVRAKISESVFRNVLLSSCDNINEEDGKAICKRVINENLSFVVDGLSVGEDYNTLCHKTEPALCAAGSPSHDEFLKQADEVRKKRDALNKKHKKKEKDEN